MNDTQVEGTQEVVGGEVAGEQVVATQEVVVGTTQEVVAPTVEATAVVTPAVVAPKVQKVLILQDANGVELERRPLGRGRPAAQSVVDAQGNRIIKGCERLADGSIKLAGVKPKAQKSAEVFYVTVDEKGDEITRERKGRGRTRPGYVQHTSGTFAGNFVGQQRKEVETSVAETTEVQATPAAEAVESAETQEAVERVFA